MPTSRENLERAQDDVRKQARNERVFDAWWGGATLRSLAEQENVAYQTIHKLVMREARRRRLPTWKRLKDLRKLFGHHPAPPDAETVVGWLSPYYDSKEEIEMWLSGIGRLSSRRGITLP